MSDTKSSIESTNDIYQSRVDALESGDQQHREDAEQREKDANLESVETPLPEEQRFVGNPEDLKKDVDSEEKYSEGLSDGDDTLEDMKAAKPATKKTAAKRS